MFIIIVINFSIIISAIYCSWDFIRWQ